MTKPKIVIASDHAGLDLKGQIREELVSAGYKVTDLGTQTKDSVNYPEYADKLADYLLANHADRGILICGSGIGMSIAANRHKGIRAALCTEATSARLARAHNDANVLCLGARLVGAEVAKDCVHAFLTTSFEGGRHLQRVQMLG